MSRINQPLLEAKDLRVLLPTDRGWVKAVDGVSFLLHRGSTLGIVGESGCGKSMLARAIMGLLPAGTVVSPESSVTFNGEGLIGMSPKRFRRIIGRKIAMIFQDPMTSLNPVMKVGRQIAEVLTRWRWVPIGYTTPMKSKVSERCCNTREPG